LERSRKAFEIARVKTDPEYFRQLATVQLSCDNVEDAVKNFRLAGALLPAYKSYATEADVRDAGLRSLNLLKKPPNWDGALGGLELLDSALGSWPEGDIHIGINVNWTAAVGLSIDSPRANQHALELLEKYKGFSAGYGHQATVRKLLTMTLNLPKNIRPAWARFALSYNAFRNR
jgi:hypothetical protein